MELKPLLAQGLHDFDLNDIGYHFLKDFPDSITRESLVEGLIGYVVNVSYVGIPIEIWIDGSFTTNKKDPEDVDIVIFLSKKDFYGLSPAKQTLLENLVERDSMKEQFHCDVYYCLSDDSAARDYWQRMYGFFPESGKPKGIARITVTP